jgi:hypothetical protein
MPKYRVSADSATPPREITGLQIAMQPRSTRERVALAVAIARGETVLVKLTDTQIARLCDVSPQYLNQVRTATAVDYIRRQRAHNVVQLAAE